MATRLNVLLLEDVVEDAELVLRELRAAGFDPDWRCVQTEDALLDAIGEREWDVIISDYKMPQFSAPQALRVVQDSALDTPFIVVSGTVGEETAVECMRAGAVDFLSKNRLLRLGPAITRELRDKSVRRARRHAEGALRRSEASARRIVAASNEGIIIVDQSKRVRFVNPAAEVMLNKSAEDLVGQVLPVPLSQMPETVEVELRPHTGLDTVVELRTSHIDWAEEESVLVLLHDITFRKRAEQQMRDSFVNLADTLSRAMASRDPYTTDHQERVARLVMLVGERMGLLEEQLWRLRLGGLLHDIGKIAVPESLLTKPGKLAPEELGIVRTHPQEGYEILKGAGLPATVALMALHHHELLDGSGYPSGLAGESLGLEDRILAACNLVESMTSFRPYRRAFSLRDAISRLVSGSGTRFDADVVACLKEVLDSGEFVVERS